MEGEIAEVIGEDNVLARLVLSDVIILQHL